MAKDFSDIKVGDKIYFMSSVVDNSDCDCQEIEVKDIVEVQGSHIIPQRQMGDFIRTVSAPLVNTKFVGNNGMDIEIRNVYDELVDKEGVLKTNSIPPHSPIYEATIRVGNKGEVGFAATTKEGIMLVREIFGAGYETAQYNIKKQYLAFTDAMGIERPYRPPQRLM